MENLTLKQQNFILKLDNSISLESIQNLSKHDASMLIAKLMKAAKRAKVQVQHFSHGFNVGDILYASWGYEQTNLDFFKVVKATEKSIRIIEVTMETTLNDYMSHGMARDVAFDTKTAKPIAKSFWIKDQEHGDLKRIGSYEYNGHKEFYVHVGRGGYMLHHYEGQKLYESWYA